MPRMRELPPEQESIVLKLSTVAALCEKVRHAAEEVKQLRDVRAILTSDPSRQRVSGTRGRDGIADRLADIEERESELIRDIGHWVSRQREADRLIQSLDDPVQMRVLNMRYVEGATMAEVSDALHYSRKYIYEIHNAAIARLADAA